MNKPVTVEGSKNFQAQWNLLSSENLARVGIKESDIVKVEPFFSVPGTLYTEPNIASETHPAGGSIGVWIYTEKSRVSIQDIIYYDFNPYKTHYFGLPHWNHERRYIDATGYQWRITEGIENHIIDDCERLNLSFDDKCKQINRTF